MKIKFFAKAIALGALVYMFLAPSSSTAQVINPYSIMNNLLCPVKIKYTIYSWTPNGCTNPCDVGTVTVSAGPPPFFISWNPACAGCAVDIEILDIGGVPVFLPIIASFGGSLPPHANGPAPASCSPTGNVNLDVHPHGADINP